MRKRTLFGIVALVFAVPALASDLPRAKPVSPESLVAIADLQAEGAFDDLATPGTRTELLDAARKNYEAALKQEPAHKDALRGLARLRAREAARTPSGPAWLRPENAPSVCFELRFLKIPSAFYRELNVKLPDNGVLSAAEAKKLLDAAELCRRASVMQCPMITTASGQTATFRSCDDRTFVTGGEAMKVKGQTVFVPQNKRVELGTVATLAGSVAPDGKGVGVRAKVSRTWLAGEPELVPVVTKITPIFEGGSVGQPIPFTQYLQAPDVRTAAVEKGANVPSGGTLVVGVWSETQEVKAGKKAKPEAVEYTCVALATVRVLPPEPAAAPMPRAVPPLVPKVYEVGDLLGPAAKQGGAVPTCGSGEQLVKVVTGMVRPYSWQSAGGRGTAEYFEIGSALVVKNSPDVLRELGDLLEAMRRQKAASAAPTAPEANAVPPMQPPEPPGK